MPPNNSQTLAAAAVQGYPATGGDRAAKWHAGLVRGRAATIAVASVVVIVPCFWQRHLEAGDLGSHVYNAWLAQLIASGGVPGLSIVRQSNNVLFDLMLAAFAKFFSLDFAARLSAAVAVLTFFWGAFAFAGAIAKRPPWFLSALIAIVAYGWTFNFGFFNYYLSVGLALAALAIFLSARGWTRLVWLAFAPLILLGHPLGLLWAIGAAGYIVAAEFTPHRFHLFLVLGGVAAIALVRIYLRKHFHVEPASHSALFYSGLDQILFTSRYELLMALFAAFLVVALAAEMLRRGGISSVLDAWAVPLGLYLLIEAAIELLPDAVYLPHYAAPLSDLDARLTLISAVLLCCLLGTVQPRAWHWAATTAIALLFFAFLYQDTARLNRMHDRIDALTLAVPPGQRVVFHAAQPMKYRFSFKHILDESCIGHCFSYANYEPASKQFRVRVSPGNRFVLSDIHDVAAVEAGTYVAQPRDLPLYEIYSCGVTAGRGAFDAPVQLCSTMISAATRPVQMPSAISSFPPAATEP